MALEACVLSFIMASDGKPKQFAIPDCAAVKATELVICKVKELGPQKAYAVCVEVDVDGIPQKVLYSGPAYPVQEI